MAETINELQGQRLYTSVRLTGLLVGLFLLIMPFVFPAPEGLSDAGWKVMGVTGLMAVWWVTGPVNITVTALVPLVAFPFLGVADFKAAAAPYSHPTVYLFFGGFLIARALQRWNLHKRIALLIASSVGTRPDMLILGFMIAVAFLSMWVSNTATAVMMLPVAASVISYISGPDGDANPANNRIGTAMMLGIAYAASIGGIGTLVGTPPNAFMAAFLSAEPYNYEISFVGWMALAVPLVIVMLPLCWFILTHIMFRECLSPELRKSGAEGRKAVREALKELGPMKTAEWRVGGVFLFVALAWMFRPLLSSLPGLEAINDSSIGVLGGLLMFLMPAGTLKDGLKVRLLSWEDAEKLPWGVLILFGGGLSMAALISQTGASDWIGSGLSSFETMPLLLMTLCITGTILLLTELTSNVTTTAALLPIIAALGTSAGIDPILLAVPAALAASCAFMLPVATPPNAVVFASGYITIPQMIKAGVLVNLVAIGVITLAAYFYLPVFF